MHLQFKLNDSIYCSVFVRNREHFLRPVSRGGGGATGAIAPPKMNPGCTSLGPYPGGCNRCKCEIKAHLVEISIENRLWSKRARKCKIFLGTWPPRTPNRALLLDSLWGMTSSNPGHFYAAAHKSRRKVGCRRPASLCSASCTPQDKNLATALHFLTTYSTMCGSN